MIIYDPFDSALVFAEVEIQSFAKTSGERLDYMADSTPQIKVVDNKNAICLIYHGKRWSLVSMKDAISWRRNNPPTSIYS